MKWSLRRGALAVSFLAVLGIAVAQFPGEPPRPVPPESSADVRLPNGKSQRDEILKAEHEENLKDAAKLADLTQELKEDLEKQDRFVFSLATLKKTEEIEKLAKKIRSRLRHD